MGLFVATGLFFFFMNFFNTTFSGCICLTFFYLVCCLNSHFCRNCRLVGAKTSGYTVLESNQCCRTAVKSTGNFSAYTGWPDLSQPRLKCLIASMLYKERCWALTKKHRETHSHRELFIERLGILLHIGRRCTRSHFRALYSVTVWKFHFYDFGRLGEMGTKSTII